MSSKSQSPVDRARLGRRSKAKGKEFEKAIAQAVSEWIGLDISDIVRARSGIEECDIGLSTEAQRRFPFALECKNRKTMNVPEWIRQIKESNKKRSHLTPIIVFKQHRDGTPYVIIEFFHFMELATRHLVEKE